MLRLWVNKKGLTKKEEERQMEEVFIEKTEGIASSRVERVYMAPIISSYYSIQLCTDKYAANNWFNNVAKNFIASPQ